MYIRIFLLHLILYAGSISAQVTDSLDIDKAIISEIQALEDTLHSLGDIILYDSLLIKRQQANAQFCLLFEQGMKNKNAYHYPFDSLLSVSKLTAPDNSFKLYTWQFFESDDSYVYYGYILHEDGRVVRLDDNSNNYLTPEFEVGDDQHWYGVLYYNMTAFKGENGEEQFLLFGYDGNSLMERRKVIDVLSWDEKGKPIFGAPIFLASSESRGHPPTFSRVVLEYFAAAKVNCNYDEFQNQVLFAHLIYKKTPYGDFLIPDGSYEGYIYTEGKWKHNVKVFNQISEKPPFPEPVLTKKLKKDLFGNEYKRSTLNPNRNPPKKKKKG